MSKGMRTEDEVRDSAKLVLGFDKTEDGVQQGTGQITTFNQLGFRGCNDKPDGWYLPDDASKPAIILETKSEAEGVSKEKHVKELFKNIDVVAKKYSKTIGILYSGSAIRVFRNKIELSDASKRLENKDYYIRLCTSQKLDSNYIFEITQKINNSLHFKFGMTDLQDRMIFTACALVAQRYNPQNGLQMLKLSREEFVKELKRLFDEDKIGYAQVVVATDIHDLHRIVLLTDHTQKDKLSRIAVSLFGVPKREARRIIAKYQAQ